MRARLPSASPASRFAPASQSMTISETAVSTMPNGLASGRSYAASVRTASNAT